MTSYLLPEHGLIVLPTLACATSLVEAIVLQQVHYLALRSNGDGWVSKSTDDWLTVFPFLSKRSIERAFASLRSRELLIVAPVPGGGRRTRVRIDHDALDSLTEKVTYSGEVNRQSGGTKPPNWRDQTAKLAGPNRQSGGARASEWAGEEQQEEQQEAASLPRATRDSPENISTVFTEWVKATDRTDAVLDDKRRRLIAKALRLKGLPDCVGAVKGWRHSSWHRGANPDRAPRNDLGLLLADAETIERLSALERHRGDSGPLGGNVADRCPGQPADDVAGRWEPIAVGLAELVPADQHAIWLSSLHPHAELDGTLVVGIAPEVITWVADRFRTVLTTAAGGTPVTLVECTGPA